MKSGHAAERFFQCMTEMLFLASKNASRLSTHRWLPVYPVRCLVLVALSLVNGASMAQSDDVNRTVAVPDADATQLGDATLEATGRGAVPQSLALPLAGSETGGRPNRRIEAVGPDVYYVPDESGKLVPVPAGMTVADFQKLFQIEQGLARPDVPPQYVLQETTIVGEAVEDRVDLKIKMVLDILSDRPVRILLGMGNVIHRATPTSTDLCQVSIRYDESAGGYVAWVTAEKGSTQELDLHVWVPIQRIANQNRLNLQTPRATVSSFELTVPENQPTITVSENVQLRKKTAVDGGGTKLVFAGGSGVLRLSWDASVQSDSAPVASSLEVESTLMTRVDGPDVMRTEATFRLQSFGQPASLVRIRLPRNATVVSTSQAPYQVTIEALEQTDQRQVAVFRLPEATSDRFTLQLIVEQRIESVDGDSAPEVSAGDFFVEGAFRHLGYLALAAEGDWLPRWDASSTLRPTAEVPAEFQSQEGVTVFRYYQQPFQLPLTILQKKTRISVAPICLFDVQPDRVELRALLDVTVHGAPTQTMLVNLPGWDVYDIADTVTIRDDELVLQEDPLRIPFVRPRRGRFAIEIRARRVIQPGESRLTLRLPRVQDASAAQPIVVTQASDNVQLDLLPGESSHLVPARVPLGLTLPDAGTASMCHRIVDATSEPIVVYGLEMKPQRVQASVVSMVDIRDASVEVEQQISFDIRNEPVYQFALRLPAANPPGLSVQELELSIDGVPIPPTPDAEFATLLTENAKATRDDVRYSVFELPFGAIGSVDAKVTYVVAAQTSADVRSIPFPVPEVDQIVNHETHVTTNGQIAARLDDDRWTLVTDSRRRDKRRVLIASAQGGVDSLKVRLTESDENKSSTVVQRAFMQTWSTHDSRRDLAIFQFDTNEKTLRVRIPEEAILGELLVVLDKEPIRVVEARDLIEVDLSDVPRGEHVLELSYVFDEPLGTFRHTIELPRIEDAQWTQEFYWQLVLPSKLILAKEPTELVSANHWGWHGMTWGRIPQHEQEWFEQWIGSSPQRFEPPIETTNRYLFATFVGVERLQVVIASQTIVAFALLGGAFLVGSLMLSFEVMRRPLSLLVLACGCALVGLAVPASVLAIVPPIAFGCCLAGLVPLIRNLLNSTRPRSRTSIATTIRRAESSSARSLSLRSSSSKRAEPNATTATMQVPQDA